MIKMTEAETALNSRRYKVAATLFRAAAAEEPDNVLAHQGLARALLHSKAYDDAISACRKALALSPNLSLSHVIMARAHYGNEDFDAFRAETQEAYKLDPTSADVLTCRGIMFLLDRHLDAAINSLGDAVRANPKDAIAHTNLWYAFRSVGQKRKALNEARRAFVLAPSVRSGLRLLSSFHEANTYVLGTLLFVCSFAAFFLHSVYLLIPLWLYGITILWTGIRLLFRRQWRLGFMSLVYVAVLSVISWAFVSIH